MPHPVARKLIALLFICIAGRALAAQSNPAIDAMIARLKNGQTLNNSPKSEVRQLVAHGVDPRDAIPALKPLLYNENLYLCMIAGSVLWEIGPAGIDAVFAACDDPDPQHRLCAIEVLQFNHYSAAAESKQVGERFVQAYRRAFKDANDKVRWMALYSARMSPFPTREWVGDAAQMLAGASPGDACEIEMGLIRALADARDNKPDKQLPPDLRRQVLDALIARYRADLATGDRNRIWQALNTMGNLGAEGRPLAPDLVRAWSAPGNQGLKNSIESVLRDVAPNEHLLPTLAPAPKAPRTTQTLAQLIERLKGSDAGVCKNAAETLGKMGPSAAAAVPALAAATRDARKRAHDRTIGNAYEWNWAAVEAMQALGAIGSPAAEAAMPELLDALYDPDSQIRYWAVKNLAGIGRPRSTVLPLLVRMLNDNDDEIRRAAAEGLGALGPAAAPVLPQLLETYRDDPHGVSRDLIWPIAQIDQTAALPLLIEGVNDPEKGNIRRLYAEILGDMGPAAAPAIPALAIAVANREKTWVDEDGEKALLKLAGRAMILEWAKGPDATRRRAAANVLRDLGTEADLKAISPLVQTPDRAVAATAREIELSIRRRLFKEPGERTLAELIDDFRVDDVPKNAQRAWRALQWQSGANKLDAIQRAFASTTDTQQRKILAVLVANHPMTTPTLELLGLMNENLRTGSLADAARGAVDWMINAQLAQPLADARTKLLRDDERSTDSQLARLAALALQYDMSYKPAPAELALLAENLEDDGIAGNAETALEILARRDVPGKRERLEKLVGSKDPQAQGRAALALVQGPNPAKMTPRLFRALVENLKLDYDIAGETVDQTSNALGRCRIPAKREILEAALRSSDDNRIFHRRVARLLLQMPGYRPSPAMIDHLILQLHADGVTNNAQEAVHELDRLRSPMVIRKLEQALDSDDRQQRLWAADALPAPHEYPGGPPPRLIAVLLENLDDEYHLESGGWLDDWRSLDNAKGTAKYLIDHPKLATHELEVSLDSGDPQRRWLAAIILGSTGRTRRIGRITEILIPQLRVGGHEWMAGHALEGLGKPVRPYLERYRNDPDPTLRRNVEVILADLKRPPKTRHDLYMREDKFGLPDTEYLLDLPEYWSYEDRP
ncbi:HEAT repeat domain-containing protein [bacterium]|nr:HEAT repeat domain-containing protein [bacterium]